MRFKLNYLLLAAIALSLSSCSLLGNDSEADVIVDSVEEELVFEETELEEVEVEPETVPTYGLIPSTNPEKRVNVIEKGRTNPFALIAVQPNVEVAPLPVENSSPKTVDNSSNSGSNTSNNRSTVRQIPPKTQPKVTVPPTIPPTAPMPKTQPTTPPPEVKQPEPEIIARQVEVVGVIDVNGVPKAIVKAPLESSSRYVETNQSLSGGRIIVKQINPGTLELEPQVVLEDIATGVEIIKMVGELPPAETEETVALVH